MSANGGDTDSLLEKVFSAVSLPPVEFPNRKGRPSFQSRSSQSEDDEQKALRQLDDILQQNSSAGSLIESEPSEGGFSLEDDHSSSTLKSAKSSRANTETHGEIEITHTEYFDSQQNTDIGWRSEIYDSFDLTQINGARSLEDKGSHLRSRSFTFDSLASAAESRYGGFDLCDEDGNNNVSVYNNFSLIAM